MSLLYKEAKDLKYYLDIKQEGNRVVLSFSADCGKNDYKEELEKYKNKLQELYLLLEKARNRKI